MIDRIPPAATVTAEPPPIAVDPAVRRPLGDIAAGAALPAQLVRRPKIVDPYRLTDRVFLCSSAAGAPGVHGMVGWHAARTLLADRGLSAPDLGL